MFICISCVNPEPLKKYIKNKNKKTNCAYCNAFDFSVKTIQLYNCLEQRFKGLLVEENFLSPYERGMISECGSDIPVVKELWEWIGDFNIAMPNITEEFYHWINDRWHNKENQLYALDDGTLEDNEYENKWDRFTEKLFHSQRFFNQDVELFLDSLFKYLNIKPNEQNKLIKVIEPEVQIYRARVANSNDSIQKIESEPHTELGPAPGTKARNQRMTPTGISAIYCCFERETCLSEIRAITGDIVVSGAFSPLKALRLLDLNKFRELDDGNPHPLTFEFSKKKHIFQFLKQLITKLSIPKRAGEELSYLPTQVLFEYFEKKYGDLVDGLTYPSIQTGLTGQNLVLFPLKSKTAKENYILNHDENINNPFIDLINYDALPPTLKFIKDSLIFHKITAIKTESEDSEDPFIFMADPLTRKRLSI
ncbi:RES domain protein [Legionella nautarum]|uniref:RES domain protein n=1 Tax=Legionella nautarum TaxID=45070 RepID=A0A0W0WL20_9GAMM|nr:RES family NAD+ phosphorylase [Legionella nautarum]KTD33024.1 RES domain protein [Legionella nautarum]